MISYFCNHCKKTLGTYFHQIFLEIRIYTVGNWLSLKKSEKGHFCDIDCYNKFQKGEINKNQNGDEK